MAFFSSGCSQLSPQDLNSVTDSPKHVDDFAFFATEKGSDSQILQASEEKEFLFLSTPFPYYITSHSLHKVRIETPGFMEMNERMGFQCSAGDIVIPILPTAKLSLLEYKTTAQIYTRGKGGCKAVKRVCLTPQSPLDGIHPPKEGLILHLLCCSAQQHYNLCVASVVYVDLAGDALWQDARLEVCLPAYYCNFIKLLADTGLFSITDLYL